MQLDASSESMHYMDREFIKFRAESLTRSFFWNRLLHVPNAIIEGSGSIIYIYWIAQSIVFCNTESVFFMTYSVDVFSNFTQGSSSEGSPVIKK